MPKSDRLDITVAKHLVSEVRKAIQECVPEGAYTDFSYGFYFEGDVTMDVEVSADKNITGDLVQIYVAGALVGPYAQCR